MLAESSSPTIYDDVCRFTGVSKGYPGQVVTERTPRCPHVVEVVGRRNAAVTSPTDIMRYVIPRMALRTTSVSSLILDSSWQLRAYSGLRDPRP